MPYVICEKHDKVQKTLNRINTNASICLNRYCPNSMKIICEQCKKNHKDHINKILNIEDITFLITRLVKCPTRNITNYVCDAIEVMKKLKLIRQFKVKIDILKQQTQKQALKLIQYTQETIEEFGICKKTVIELQELLNSIENPKKWQQFRNSSEKYLSHIDYNIKKDKIQFESKKLLEFGQKHKKTYHITRQKIQQVKDYSMKIIQVILHNEDSQSDDEDIIYKRKYYEILKNELLIEIKKQQQIQINDNNSKIYKINSNSMNHVKFGSSHQKSQVKHYTPLKKSMIGTSNIFTTQNIEQSSQTNNEWITTIQNTHKDMTDKIEKIKLINAKSENQLKNRIALLNKQKQNFIKQKQNLNKQIQYLKSKLQQKKIKIIDIEKKLKSNRNERLIKQNCQQKILQKLIDLSNWKDIIQNRNKYQ